MRARQLRSSLLLLLTATIWGAAFVAQSVGMDYVGAFTFNAARSFIGGLVLLPVLAARRRQRGSTPRLYGESASRRTLLLGGIACGFFLCLASAFQQIGIQYTSSVGKAGFLTACYIIFVPIFQVIFSRLPFAKQAQKSVSPLIWAAVALAVGGLYLLCVTDSLAFDRADVLVLCCAICFALHILVIDKFSPEVDGMAMSCVQFFVCGLLSLVPALLLERPQLWALLAAWKPILYAGALSSGVGYTLQIIGQKDMNPTVASLIMSLESCVSVLAGWAMLGQRLSARELAGCGILFAAIILAQLPKGGAGERNS